MEKLNKQKVSLRHAPGFAGYVKIVKEVAALKIDGCMHPLTKIEGCSCTRSNKGPALSLLPKMSSGSAPSPTYEFKISTEKKL